MRVQAICVLGAVGRFLLALAGWLACASACPTSHASSVAYFRLGSALASATGIIVRPRVTRINAFRMDHSFQSPSLPRQRDIRDQVAMKTLPFKHEILRRSSDQPSARRSRVPPQCARSKSEAEGEAGCG